TGVTGSLSFGAGEATKTITVNINNDSAAESSEAFTVVLSNIADATSASESITTATGTATIADNDSAGFTIGAVSAHTTESGGTATFTLRLNSQPTADVVVTVASSNTAEGTAATTLTFTSANWNIDQTVTVTGVDETGAQLDDGDIGYQVDLTAASGDGAYNGMTGSASVINDDNDGPPVVSIGNVSVGEADGTATFTVTRTGTLGGTTTVDYASANGTATAGSDYTAVAGSLSFAPGETSKTITVNITNDTSVESAENFTVTLSNVADPTSPGESIGTATGTATITDNDVAAPSRTVRVVGSNDVSEGSNAVFTVTLSASSAAPTVVSLALGEVGDSAEPADYSSGFTAYYFTSGNVKQPLAISGGSVTLPGGVTAFHVSVGTTADSVYEGPESFTLEATLNSGASDTGQATLLDDGRGTVYDDKRVPTTGTPDDDRPLITVTGAERVSEGSNAVYTVQLSGVSELPLVVALTLGDPGDSAESDDYVPAPTAYYFDGSGVKHVLAIVDGSVTLPAGVTTFHVSVPTTNDEPKVFEGGETLTLGAGLIGRPISTGTATIVDDGSGEVYDDTGEPTDVPTDDDRPISADLDPDDDNGQSNEDRVTSIIDPEFTVVAGTLLEEGQTVRIVAPDGSIIGVVGVTPADVVAGRVNVPSIQLDDGTYIFMAQIISAGGELVGEAPVTVTIITDRDGVMPSVELSANGGDYNHDGVADWEQNNVAHLPLTSLEDYLAGVNAPDSSFGAVMAGNLDAGAPGTAVQLDPTAQLLDLSISEAPGAVPAIFTQASPVLNFSITSQDGATLRDIDPVRTGLQTRVVIDLPAGTLADTFIKWDADTGTWFEYLDDGD
ncbi:MAG: Calx-beta domain-containing protein, partial [Phycisphaerae bacterium]